MTRTRHLLVSQTGSNDSLSIVEILVGPADGTVTQESAPRRATA
jgi:hypothetical protein